MVDHRQIPGLTVERFTALAPGLQTQLTGFQKAAAAGFRRAEAAIKAQDQGTLVLGGALAASAAGGAFLVWRWRTQARPRPDDPGSLEDQLQTLKADAAAAHEAATSLKRALERERRSAAAAAAAAEAAQQRARQAQNDELLASQQLRSHQEKLREAEGAIAAGKAEQARVQAQLQDALAAKARAELRAQQLQQDAAEAQAQHERQLQQREAQHAAREAKLQEQQEQQQQGQGQEPASDGQAGLARAYSSGTSSASQQGDQQDGSGREHSFVGTAASITSMLGQWGSGIDLMRITGGGMGPLHAARVNSRLGLTGAGSRPSTAGGAAPPDLMHWGSGMSAIARLGSGDCASLAGMDGGPRGTSQGGVAPGELADVLRQLQQARTEREQLAAQAERQQAALRSAEAKLAESNAIVSRMRALTLALDGTDRQLAASMLGVEPFEEASGTGEPGDLGVERSGDLNAPPTPVGELAMADV